MEGFWCLKGLQLKDGLILQAPPFKESQGRAYMEKKKRFFYCVIVFRYFGRINSFSFFIKSIFPTKNRLYNILA